MPFICKQLICWKCWVQHHGLAKLDKAAVKIQVIFRANTDADWATGKTPSIEFVPTSVPLRLVQNPEIQVLLCKVKSLGLCIHATTSLCPATLEHTGEGKPLKDTTIPSPVPAVNVERNTGLATWCEGSSHGPVSSCCTELSG